MKLSDAFRPLQLLRPEPAEAREAFLAVYRTEKRADVIIAAASLSALTERWTAFTGMPLDGAQVQRVAITNWRPSDVAA